MTIYFNSKKLAKVCNSEYEARRKFGKRNAKKILQRLNEISASENLDVLHKLSIVGFHQLKGKRKGQFAVSVKQPFRIVFQPFHDPIPRKEDRTIDLERITRVLILEVVDYHG